MHVIHPPFQQVAAMHRKAVRQTPDKTEEEVCLRFGQAKVLMLKVAMCVVKFDCCNSVFLKGSHKRQ